MLRIKGLTKRYRTGDLALKGIDLAVPDGQVMALIGPSGAGKSTVIRCINRLVEPTAGHGHPQRHRAHHARPRRSAPRAAAHGHDLPGIRAGRAAERDGERADRPARLCRRSGASFLRSFPQSDIDEAFRLLDARRPRPHGRQARRRTCPAASASASASAARCIQNPELLLVDEPTASLDPKTSRQIMRLIKELVRRAQALRRSSTSTTSCWRRCSPSASSACSSARSSMTARRPA